MGLKEIYLILYNGACCVGWALVLQAAIVHLINGVPEDGLVESLSSVYQAETLSDMLTYAQGAAVMEILHSLLGLVRSPVSVTFLQVSSRIVALVAILFAPSAQGESVLWSG